jgi:hypothetical protein
VLRCQRGNSWGVVNHQDIAQDNYGIGLLGCG